MSCRVKWVAMVLAIGLMGVTSVMAKDKAPTASDTGSVAVGCTASLRDFAWFEGRWIGELKGTPFELQYSGIDGGVIMSMFRLMPEEGANVLELGCLRESAGDLEIRFRHFGPDLVAWEEKDAPITMRCVKSGENAWTFLTTNQDPPMTTVITRKSNDEYQFRAEIAREVSQLWTMEATAHRAGTSERSTAMPNRETRSLVKEAIVNGSAAQVWAAWTDPKEMGKFFAADSSMIDLRIGGTYELHMNPDAPPGGRGCEGCTILSYLPLRMLSFTWTAPPSIPGLRDKGIKTQVVVTMDELESNRTHVRIAQMGFGDGENWDECYAYFDRAWPKVLTWLGEKIDLIKPAANAAVSDPRLVLEVAVNASTTDVWKAFTTVEGVESWMVPLAEVDFRLNGTMRTNYNPKGTIGDPGTITHRFMSFEPERMLAFRVEECPLGFPHKEATKGTWAVIQFDPLADGTTRVRLASAGLKSEPGTEEMIRYFEQGNAWTLQQLQKRFADSSAGSAAAGAN